MRYGLILSFLLIVGIQVILAVQRQTSIAHANDVAQRWEKIAYEFKANADRWERIAHGFEQTNAVNYGNLQRCIGIRSTLTQESSR